MECPKCGNDNQADVRYCRMCGSTLAGHEIGSAQAPSSELPMASSLHPTACSKAVKVWLTGGLTGFLTGLGFTLVVELFSNDGIFELWELGISLTTPAAAGVVAARVARSGIKTTLSVAYLTVVIPLLGPMFGASGSEPLWQFWTLGLVGGLVWSVPVAIVSFVQTRTNRSR